MVDKSKFVVEYDALKTSEIWKLVGDWVKRRIALASTHILSDDISRVDYWRGYYRVINDLNDRLCNPDKLYDDCERETTAEFQAKFTDVKKPSLGGPKA